jgi:hypothetical protein
MVKYTQRYTGEPFEVDPAGFNDRCCDCGLVHRNKITVKSGVMYMTSWRDNRSTANSRRSKTRFKRRGVR